MKNKKLSVLLILFCIFTFSQLVSQEQKWSIVLHGGAGSFSGTVDNSSKNEYVKALFAALEVGKSILESGGASIDAVEAVVVELENCPLFNAGKGAVVNADGFFELDAAIMDGTNLMAGAVAGVKDIKNPVKAARMVMDSTKHVLLIGEGASAFAVSKNLEIVPNSYFSTEKRVEQYKKIQKDSEKPYPGGTVGCVALDVHGNLSAATSTGGMSGKRWGRVGDVPVIGAGTYANKIVAVSGTGHGEIWIRRVVAHDIAALMEYKDMSLEDASNEVIFNKVGPMGGSGGGIIAVDGKGNISMVFNTDIMYRAWAKSNGEQGAGIIESPVK